MELFGFTFGKKQQDPVQDTSIRLPVEENDGTTIVSSGTQYSYSASIDPTWKSEADLIQYYRDMSMNHTVDKGIEEIVTDAIVVERGQPVKVDFEEDSTLSESIKKKIAVEFDQVLKLLDFRNEGHSLFRDWYVDGRLGMFKVVDPKNTKRGIIDLQKLDVINLKKFRKVKTKKEGQTEVIDGIEEYFIYSTTKANAGSSGMVQYMNNRSEMKIKPEAVAYITSGLVDKKQNWVLSYLHKAIRPQNHLRLLEDAALIYKMVRAPERRVFYIDVGNLPRNRAEEYLRDIMNKYRNKITYDAKTGDIKDDRRAMSMMEDFWLPRRDGGKGTEISTLPGGTNQSIDDLDYFKKNLYEALNIPLGRLEPTDGFSIGRSTEMTRDEVKFSAFIDKLRNRFSGLFFDLLKTQLILKGIIAPTDWDQIRGDLYFVFESNVLFAEMKKIEVIQNRLGNLAQVEQYVGSYFSKKWVQKNILFMTDEEIEAEEEAIAEEISSGIILDPHSMYDDSGDTPIQSKKPTPQPSKKNPKDDGE